MTSLQRLELRGCRLSAPSVLDAAATLVQLRQLTALMLEGDLSSEMEMDGAVTQLATALLALTNLLQLDLVYVPIWTRSAQALAGALAGPPRLCSLELSLLECMDEGCEETLLLGVAACTALTKLCVSYFELVAGSASVRAQGSIQARLRSLALDEIAGLSTESLSDILSVPSLLGLTSLSLSGVSLRSDEPWPWRPLCALTALQELRLSISHLRDAGAEALAPHVCALAQLRRLDVSWCGLTVGGSLAQALWRLRMPQLQQLACKQVPGLVETFEMPADARSRGLELVTRIE